ncbi:MAG: LytTR family transcriptional regulator [Ruminococcaceae bacterium]|nr:LytTR family transcriptional regulator [Oscillospiraceae bacterium]
MEIKLIIDENRKEEVIIYAHNETPLINDIKNLIENHENEIIAYDENEIIKLSIQDVYCFTIESSKLYAITENNKLMIKQRLYQIEKILDNSFVKINQSSIANIKKIEKFSVSIGGTLIAKFKNGYKDYVSRRQVKTVKERIGI